MARGGEGVGLVRLVVLLLLWDVVLAQIRYSIPEELEHGAFVGNLAEDLGLAVERLSARRFRLVSGARRQYLEVNLENGVLFVNERIDREELCEQNPFCSFHLQVVMERPLELYRVEVEITDVNDHSPGFPWSAFNLDISESAVPGSRFPLESAQDLDVGTNSLRTYLLHVNDHFLLDVQTRSDGSKFAELVLESPLDREKQRSHQMVLTAVDGGSPERTGTAQIDVTVLDANDNAPVFERSFYRVRLAENAPLGTVVIRLNASDLDEGPNADITYSFSGHAPVKVRELFGVDARTGEITVTGVIDYEKARMHEIYVQAKDKGPSAVAVHCKVLVNVLDTNDNAPEVILTSVSTPVQEDAPPGTVIAVISVTDRDSGENGNVDCEIPHHVPFQLHSSFKNYYTLVTSDLLDREAVAEYNITVTARDMGTPPRVTRRTVVVQVADVNDNEPRFKQPSYTVYLTENNAPGAALCAVTALDPDAGQNAYLSYSLLDGGDVGGMPVSTYVSVNSDNGNVYALRSFDHERLRSFQIRYSIPEELEHGAFVGNLAEDLGLAVERLSARRFRLVSGARRQYLEVNLENGVLFVNERIDREELCEQNPFCSFHLQVVMARPLEAPVHSWRARRTGRGHQLLRTYLLHVNDHFLLDVQTRSDGSKFAELVLESPLDREKQRSHQMVLTAVDGGSPERTGTAQIDVTVLDANDNAPVFERSFYRVRLAENAPLAPW
ncbi:unnamed protein product [Boreogadus saida]